MIRPIFLYPCRQLAAVCAPVPLVTPTDLALATQLLDDLWDTMLAADGAGLAAPQLGATVRAAVVSAGGERLLLLNPTFEPDPEAVPMDVLEGCLSMPGGTAVVTRPGWGRLTWQDVTGGTHTRVVEGIVARGVQHELDHLDGRMFLDHLSFAKRSQLASAWRKLHGQKGNQPTWDPSPEPSDEQRAIVASRAARKAEEAKASRIKLVKDEVISLPAHGLLGPDGQPIGSGA